MTYIEFTDKYAPGFYLDYDAAKCEFQLYIPDTVTVSEDNFPDIIREMLPPRSERTAQFPITEEEGHKIEDAADVSDEMWQAAYEAFCEG